MHHLHHSVALPVADIQSSEVANIQSFDIHETVEVYMNPAGPLLEFAAAVHVQRIVLMIATHHWQAYVVRTPTHVCWYVVQMSAMHCAAILLAC